MRRLAPTNAKHRTSVVVLRDPQALSAFIPAWEELAAAALEPNVFYEHWMLLPALEAFGPRKDVAVVLVLLHDPHNPAAPAKLGGLFPLEPVHRFGKLKVSAVSLWQHLHCYLCTPLVRADAAKECMVELFRWFQSGAASASLMELGCISGDGPFHKILIDVTNELGLRSCITDIFTRGLWHAGYDENPESSVSGELRRRLRRKERRLSERGRVEHLVLRPGDDVGRWIDEFLQIEASGWKGQRGSALASSQNDRGYFTEIVTSAFRRGRLLMLGLDFDGRPIARRCAFVAGEGSFAFKTAYDEEFADFSPGAILEMDSIRQLHTLPGARWMDSCATTDNFLVNRLSNDRKTIQSVAIGAGALGELLVSSLPLMRWATRRILKMFSADNTGDSPGKTPDSWDARNFKEMKEPKTCKP